MSGSKIVRWCRIAVLLTLALNLAMGVLVIVSGQIPFLSLGAVLFLTAVACYQTHVIRKIRTREAATGRPRPDYGSIARMERELYGETFKHEGAPGATDPDVAELHAMMDALAERVSAAKRQPVRFAACPQGHPDQLWVEGRGQVCPECRRHATQASRAKVQAVRAARQELIMTYRQRGLTAKEISEKTGLSPQSVHRVIKLAGETK